MYGIIQGSESGWTSTQILVALGISAASSVAFAAIERRAEHLEHAEFLVRDQSKQAQQRMLEDIATTDAACQLPLLHRETYAKALAAGRFGSDTTS